MPTHPAPLRRAAGARLVARGTAALAAVSLAVVPLAAVSPAGAMAWPAAPAGAAPAAPAGATAGSGPVAGCRAPGPGGPGYNASVGTKQNGTAVCLKVGQKLLVFLAAPRPQGPDWAPVAVSPPGVLGPAPLTLMVPRGTTAQNFRALRVGTARLGSSRPVCPATPGRPHCMAIEGWSVEVVVKAA